MMPDQSPEEKRKSRFASIRATLQESPVLKKNKQNLEIKITKMNQQRQNIKNEYESITESQINLRIAEENLKEEDVIKGKFLEKYEMSETIGAGSNGFVRKCYEKSTQKLFAVKTIMLDDEHILFLTKNFKYIKCLMHKNIIKYHELYIERSKSTCHLVMDYIESPDLSNFINKLSEEQIKNISYQLVDALAYIHANNICHRDIKPENILYDETNGIIKLVDFGVGKKTFERGTKSEMLTITGTLYYRAPEMFLGGGYDEKVDLWAVGITIYELINKGKTPFESDYLSTTINNITKGELTFDADVWSKYNKFAKDLVIRLLKKRSERLTAQEAKKHFWFNNQPAPEIDLYKSDSFSIRGYVEVSKNSSYNEVDELELRLERSLTNTNYTESSNKANKSSMKKGPGLLTKWLAESDEEDVVVDVESEEEEDAKSN